jgi:hypothetical protein
MQPPSKPAEVMMLQMYIRKVLVLNLGWHTDHPEVIVVFSVLPGKWIKSSPLSGTVVPYTIKVKRQKCPCS